MTYSLTVRALSGSAINIFLQSISECIQQHGGCVFDTDPPLNVTVEVSYLGHLTAGSSVNLTCNSAANPAADRYTWYRGNVSGFSSMLQVGSGQVLSIPSMEASHAGLYLCQARNRLGENNSPEVLLTVDKTDSEYAGKIRR